VKQSAKHFKEEDSLKASKNGLTKHKPRLQNLVGALLSQKMKF